MNAFIYFDILNQMSRALMKRYKMTTWPYCPIQWLQVSYQHVCTIYTGVILILTFEPVSKNLLMGLVHFVLKSGKTGVILFQLTIFKFVQVVFELQKQRLLVLTGIQLDTPSRTDGWRPGKTANRKLGKPVKCSLGPLQTSFVVRVPLLVVVRVELKPKKTSAVEASKTDDFVFTTGVIRTLAFVRLS